MERSLAIQLKDSLPSLTQSVHDLMTQWLQPLKVRLDQGVETRPKQVNDPIWGTVDLFSWEVAFLDTPFLQRLRGVKQLGLAQLVFPSANHDRLEHVVGVVGAVETMLDALGRRISKWNISHVDDLLPEITQNQKYIYRLAALLHDTGHGPFSHAIEPVLETQTGGANPLAPWKKELRDAQLLLRRIYPQNDMPSISEVLAVLFVLSQPMRTILAHDRLLMPRGSLDAEQFQEHLAAAILGAVSGPGASHLSQVLSSQIDADKLDYLSRDAHHSGLEIGFDTDRLLSKIEILKMTEQNLDPSLSDLIERANAQATRSILQIGIAASGFGSFEQMLIGRTFLYDRLYHHHKVRAAEAMAQRLVLAAEEERGKPFSLKEMFVPFGDESILQVFAGNLTSSQIKLKPGRSRRLASGLLNRDLLHRAFAFRGRFIDCPPGLSDEQKEDIRREKWAVVARDLSALATRIQVASEIHALSLEIGTSLATDVGTPEQSKVASMQAELQAIGAEELIVDIPAKKADAIRILARFPTGTIRVPEFSFNPVKWTDGYDLQKRTGYVFCPRSLVPLVSLAAKLIFLRRYGVVMGPDADGYIKMTQDHTGWLEILRQRELLDLTAIELLTRKRHQLLTIRSEKLGIPKDWLGQDPDLDVKLTEDINRVLQAGLTHEDAEAFYKVMGAMFNIVDHWYGTGLVTEALENEAALQKHIRSFLEMNRINVKEGAEMSGGELDLLAEGRVIVENKFESNVETNATAKAAGMQARRYAMALSSQLTIVIVAVRYRAGEMLEKTKAISVGPIVNGENRVALRIVLPHGSPLPSREKAQKKARKV